MSGCCLCWTYARREGGPIDASAMVDGVAGAAEGAVVDPSGRPCALPEAPGGDPPDPAAGQPDHSRPGRTPAAAQGWRGGRPCRRGYTRDRQHQDLSPLAAGGEGRQGAQEGRPAAYHSAVASGPDHPPGPGERRLGRAAHRRGAQEAGGQEQPQLCASRPRRGGHPARPRSSCTQGRADAVAEVHRNAHERNGRLRLLLQDGLSHYTRQAA